MSTTCQDGGQASAACSNPLSFGYQTVVNSEGGAIFGQYRTFLEVTSLITFVTGLTLNSGILILVLPVYRTLDNLDGFLLNLVFGEFVATFALAFVLFYQFASSLAPMGDAGCSFVTWLDVTSVSITVTTLISITITLHNKLYHGDSYRLHRWKFIACVCLTWIVAGIPGLPYLATAEMGIDDYCKITKWSGGAELIFICCMIVFQILLPLCLLVYLLVRIFAVLRRSAEEGDAVTTEENTPGTEANFQRAVVKRQVVFVVLVIVIFYVLLITTSFTSLGLELNINNIKSNVVEFSKIRELVSLFQCLKCAVIPLIYIVWYDKLKTLYRRKCCKKSQIYKNIQYDVYQETVSEAPELPPVADRSSNDFTDVYETDRDDVAILHINS